MERYPRSHVARRSRTGRGPATGATALALVGLCAGGGHLTQAKPVAPAAQAVPAAEPAPAVELAVVDGGHIAGQTTAENARRDGLTVVDLSDDWLPYVFSEEPGKPEPLRPFLIDLANGRFRSGSQYARPREDRYFEAFGIFPSLNMMRRRLADRRRHTCHDRVKDKVLEEMSPKSSILPEEPEKPTATTSTSPVAPGDPGAKPAGADPAPSGTPSPVAAAPVADKPPRKPLSPTEKRAVIAMQAHLRCEDLLPAKAKSGRMDPRTVAGLQIYQRLHMIADNGRIDLDARNVLLADSRELDFRGLLRALRERVVDATGLLEDGSALGVVGEVQGRTLDSAEFRPLPLQAPKTPAPGEPAAPTAGTPAKITGAPDLIAAATQAASQALGWTSPEAVLASTVVAPPPPSRRGHKAPAHKGPIPLPSAVAVRLPPPPPYHGPKMELHAEIDRGEVVLARPALDKDGHKKWHAPVSDRPTLTLYARTGDGDVALCRWPTTIGGWKTIQKSDGSMALKYKESITGDALWSEVLAGPTWHPPSGLPVRKLLVKRGDTFVAKSEIVGPGYRAGYGLVAIVHQQIMGVNDKGEKQLQDLLIRTHGTPAYRSVKRGESAGCHRLHNHLAIRLTGFLVRHRENTRDGLVHEDYVRKLEYQGQQVALESEAKGYRFKLTPPVPVTVLDGDVKGDAKSVKRLVPLATAP